MVNLAGTPQSAPLQPIVRQPLRKTSGLKLCLYAFLVVALSAAVGLALLAAIQSVVVAFVGAAAVVFACARVVALKTASSMKRAAGAYMFATLICGIPPGLILGVLINAFSCFSMNNGSSEQRCSEARGEHADAIVYALSILFFVAVPWVLGMAGHYIGLRTARGRAGVVARARP